MSEPSLRSAAALSLLIHLTFLSLVALMVRKTTPYVTPSPYIVALLPPAAKPADKTVKKAVSKAPVAITKAKATRTEGVTLKTPADHPKKEPTPAELRQYVSEKLSAIKAKKEDRQYLSDRLSVIKAKKKLNRIAALKQAITVKGRSPEGGQLPAQGQTSALNDYYQRVRDRIWHEWVFPDTSAEDLEAVISITVMKGGTVRINGFEKSSGNELFDRSALKAINRASPFEPPPYEMEIGVRFSP